MAEKQPYIDQFGNEQMYDPDAYYEIFDANGNRIVSKGNNGYIWQSVTEGVPISINEKGEWYTTPYLESDGKEITAHIPSWFEQSEYYSMWEDYVSQMVNYKLDYDAINSFNKVLKSLGNSAITRKITDKELASFGITDANLQEQYFNDLAEAHAEINGEGDAQNYTISDGKSLKGIARDFKEWSKEDLSRHFTNIMDELEKARNGTSTMSQEALLSFYEQYSLLNLVNNEWKSLGSEKDPEEFKGLTEASSFQKSNLAVRSFIQYLSSNTIFGVPARVAAAFGNLIKTGNFDLSTIDSTDFMKDPSYGYGLNNFDQGYTVGSYIGMGANLGMTMALASAGKTFVNAKAMNAAPGTIWSTVNKLNGTVAGSMTVDFVLNDLPLDLIMFANDIARYNGDVGKALYNPEEEQNVIGIPIIGSAIGWTAPSGLLTNMFGDAIVDVSLPVAGMLFSRVGGKIDDATNGGYSRLKEKAAVKNLQIQQKFTEIPVLGTGWKKFVNYMMGEADAEVIRAARKESIKQGSMDPYIAAHNSLTLSSSKAQSTVDMAMNEYKKASGIDDDVINFTKKQNIDSYGGKSQTSVSWKDNFGHTRTKTTDDTLPKKVKQAVIDYERYYSLKNIMEGDGGLIVDDATMKEFAKLEKKLEKMPQEFKDFSQKVHDYNGALEDLAVKLGVRNEDWLNQLRDMDEYDAYMVRQFLFPGEGGVKGTAGAEGGRIFTRERTGGPLADNQLDPMVALEIKKNALAKAYALNIRSELMMAFEKDLGNVKFGKTIDTANAISEVDSVLNKIDNIRKSYEIDNIFGKFKSDTNDLVIAFKEYNDILAKPGELSLSSIYSSTRNANMNKVINDFNNGKISYADGIKQELGITDLEASNIINNTFKLKGDTPLDTKVTNDNIAFDKEIKNFMGDSDIVGVLFEERGVKLPTQVTIRNERGEVDFRAFANTYVTKAKDYLYENKVKSHGVYESEYRKILNKNNYHEVATNNKEYKKRVDEVQKLDKRTYEIRDELDKALEDGRIYAAERLGYTLDRISLENQMKKDQDILDGIDQHYKADELSEHDKKYLSDKINEAKKSIDEYTKKEKELTTKMENTSKREEALREEELNVRLQVQKLNGEIFDLYESVGLQPSFYEKKYSEYSEAYKELEDKYLKKLTALDEKDTDTAQAVNLFVHNNRYYTDKISDAIDDPKAFGFDEEYIDDIKELLQIELDARKADFFKLKAHQGGHFLTEEIFNANTEIAWIREQFGKYNDTIIKDKLIGKLTDSAPEVHFTEMNHATNKYLRRGLRAEKAGAIDVEALEEFESRGGMKAVERTDSLFTQKLKTSLCLYRAEPTSTYIEGMRVGDKIDTTAWTYLAIDDDYTAPYKDGITSSDTSFTDPVLYRYHLQSGQLIYNDPGERGEEFILPRDIDATIINISDGLDTDQGNIKVVDVEVRDISSGIGNAPEYNTPDNVKPKKSSKNNAPINAIDSNMGIGTDGVPYKYEVQNGKIISMERVDTLDGYMESINHLAGGIYSVDEATLRQYGTKNAAAINRAIMAHQNNLPQLPIGCKFQIDVTRTPKGRKEAKQPYGWVRGSSDPRRGYRLENGEIVGNFDVFLDKDFFTEGLESKTLSSLKFDISKPNPFHPKNSDKLENVPIHEMLHDTMNRLALLGVNQEIKEGKIIIKDAGAFYEITDANGKNLSTSIYFSKDRQLSSFVGSRVDELQARLAKNALNKMGYQFTGEESFLDTWEEVGKTISRYAVSKRGDYRYETFAESMVDMVFNGEGAAEFSRMLYSEVKSEASKFGMAIDPVATMKANGLNIRGVFKNGEYDFGDAKTRTEKAEWLNKKRQANPYNKGEFTEDKYKKANLWDTYFSKEIYAYDSTFKTSAPDSLIERSGKYLEKMSEETSTKLINKIKEVSGEGFDSNLATVLMSGNAKDIKASLENFIIQRMENTAQELAKNISVEDGGINTARATVWSSSELRKDMETLVRELSPDLSVEDAGTMIHDLFVTQAEGYKSFESLPIEDQKIVDEKSKLIEQLYKENAEAKKIGKALDEKLGDKGYTGNVTHIIHYRKNGQDVYAVVKDPVISTIINNPLDYKEHGSGVKSITAASAFLSRTYKLGTTNLNPVSWVRNVLRDPVQATIQGGFNPLNMAISPVHFYQSLRQYGLDDATIKDVETKLKQWSTGSSQTSVMRQFQTDGTAKRINRAWDKLNDENTKVGKIVNFLETPMELWEDTFRNQIAQQSFEKAFRRTGDIESSLQRAMFDSSNSTTNFSHSLAHFKNLVSTVPYLQSAVNGTMSFWRQFNVDPIGMVTRIGSGFMVPAMAITAFNLSTEDQRNAYLNLPEWYRQGHIVLVGKNGKIFSVPIPDEIQQFYGTARKLMEFTNEATPYGIPTIMAQGVFGFLPIEVDSFFGEDGSIQLGKGTAQLVNGIIPQVGTTLYELVQKEDLFTGQDLSEYDALQTTLNALTNTFGTGFLNVINDLGFLCGASSDAVIGRNTAEELARDLFGVGFNDVKNQFMNIVGNPTEVSSGNKVVKATGLFAENERLQLDISKIEKEMAYANDNRKAELEKEKQDKIDAFVDRVGTLMNKYMTLYCTTGGLEEWQKSKLIKVLTLADGYSSGTSDSYQKQSQNDAYMDEYGLATQRYVKAGLPAKATINNLLSGENSIELQAALNSLYGTTKQATADFNNALKKTNLKDLRDRFYDAINQIYDLADANGTSPDYDTIEKIQARYLQSVDTVLVPIINEYGINVLNNNSFVNEVRSYVNGMIPSDDWKQSARNAKKFLSAKDFPTATVDVKKWLISRYSSGMKERNIASDQIVTDTLSDIKSDIDSGKMGTAKSKADSLIKGVKKSDFYISPTDLTMLYNYYNMIK